MLTFGITGIYTAGNAIYYQLLSALPLKLPVCYLLSVISTIEMPAINNTKYKRILCWKIKQTTEEKRWKRNYNITQPHNN